jgi:GAF domain-containing protein
VNSDAALDLDELTAHRPAPLRQCLAVPLAAAGHTIGALTLYSTLEPFSDADAAVLEAVAEHVALALHPTSTTERAASSTASPASQPDFAVRVVR